jgi:DNA-binding NtrC family response regulator
MDGNISKAARTLGISRTQLYVRLRKYGFSQAPSEVCPQAFAVRSSR